jgi:hypothetical protein
MVAAGCGIANTLRVNAQRTNKSIKDGGKVYMALNDLNENHKAQLTAKFGDLYEYASNEAIRKQLRYDHNAAVFYADYRKPNGDSLTTQQIEGYTQAAKWLSFLNANLKSYKAFGFKTLSSFIEACIKIIKADNCPLPGTYRNLMAAIDRYQKEGYISLISGREGNSNAKKIGAEAEQWLIAQFALPIKIQIPALTTQYNQECLKRMCLNGNVVTTTASGAVKCSNGWSPLSEERIEQILYSPENKRIWMIGRDGAHVAKEKFRYLMKTEMPKWRDSLWLSDGTGLNYKIAGGVLQQNLYKVIDVFSEVILGYDVSPSEDHVSQYMAFKMAFKTSQARPYELRYDNQGGHKKLVSQGLFDKLAKLHFNTQPYNGNSKTIEGINSRFQQYVMRNDWFYNGQNRTAKTQRAKANMEFLMENQKALPSLAEAKLILAQRVAEWNNAPHPKFHGLSRLEVYHASVNPEHTPIDDLSMIDLFWLETKCQYRNSGIAIQYTTNTADGKKEKRKYEFEVLKDGMPDADFLRKYTTQDFVVKFDPADFSYVRLYIREQNGLRFVDIAEPRITVDYATQDARPGSRKLLTELLDFQRSQMAEAKAQLTAIREATGITPEKLIDKTRRELDELMGLVEPAPYNEDGEPLVPVSNNSLGQFFKTNDSHDFNEWDDVYSKI